MNIFSKVYCRMVQGVLRLVVPLMPYHVPQLLSSPDELASLAAKAGKRKALVVTGRHVYAHGLTKPVEEALEKCGMGCEIYSETSNNPTVSNIEDALQRYRAGGCDFVVAVGGGSPMDCAKGVLARVIRPKKSILQLKGIMKVGGKAPLFFAVPTTAGSGSEATVGAVITDDETHHKFTMLSFSLVPKYALLDPVFTKSLPPAPTAETGMDALTHAVEAYIGRSTTRATRRLSVEAVRLIRENLVKAYEHGDDLDARKNMQLAAFDAGLAITASYVGYVHAVAHSIGGQYNTPHGRTNATLLPVVLEAYGKSCRKRLARLARESGVTTAKDDLTAAEEFIDFVKALNTQLHIPESIEIADADIPMLAKRAAKEANPLYPVPRLMTARELEEIYRRVKAPAK